MSLMMIAIALWGVIHVGYGLVAIDDKVRCQQGNQLPGQVCPGVKNHLMPDPVLILPLMKDELSPGLGALSPPVEPAERQ